MTARLHQSEEVHNQREKAAMSLTVRFHVVGVWSAALALFATTVHAQDNSTTQPNQVRVSLADGTTANMILEVSTLEIETRYGVLTVPLNEIRQIEFGMRFPEGVPERLSSAITDLADPSFRKREQATQELLRLGEYAYEAVKTATGSDDQEVARRAEDILAQLKDKLPPSRLRPQHDVVSTEEFKIIGLINTPSVKAVSPYFGPVELHLADLRTLRGIRGPGDTVRLDVNAVSFATQNDSIWMETDIEFDGESFVEITGSGTVDLYPQPGGGATYHVTPDGNQGWGQRGYGNNVFSSGALIGRVGVNGQPFLIGSKFRGVPSGSGQLFLRIVASPWGNESTGSYQVTVTGNPDLAEPGAFEGTSIPNNPIIPIPETVPDEGFFPKE